MKYKNTLSKQELKEAFDYTVKNGFLTLRKEFINEEGGGIDVLATKDGENYQFDIRMRGFDSQPDCMIGNFGINAYYRPLRFVNEPYRPYKNVSDFKRGINLCLKANGYTVLGYVLQD